MHVIYEVNIAYRNDIAQAYREWLREHIQDMLALPGFIEAQVFEVDNDEAQERNVCVHYVLMDEAALQNYFAQYAAEKRADGVRRFGESFRAHRRLLRPSAKMSAPAAVKPKP